jgi:hypothetical protein
MKKLIPIMAAVGALALAGCNNNNGGGAGTETNNVTGVSAGVSNGTPMVSLTNNSTATNHTP